MICLILLIMLSCQSTSYYEMAGIKNELFTRREGTAINDFINNRAFDRAFDMVEKTQSEEQKINNQEVRNMGESELVTMITSIIAGLYAVVKTIINLINKFKNKGQEK